MPFVYCALVHKWTLRLRYASVGIIFTVDYYDTVPINLNKYKSWLFLSDYISNMTVANSKASAPLATVPILSWICIYKHLNSTILKENYYSFKMFPQFWLTRSTRIIHRNQLLMTKFGRILCLTRKWRQKCSLLQVNAPLTEKTWGRGWVVLVVKTKNGGHFTRFKSKN